MKVYYCGNFKHSYFKNYCVAGILLNSKYIANPKRLGNTKLTHK